MNKALYQLILFQFKNFFRTPGIVFWAVLFPILMAWILGIAFTQRGVQRKTVYIIESSDRLMQDHFQVKDTGTFEVEIGSDMGAPTSIKFWEKTEEEALLALKRGQITLYLQIRNDEVVYNFDPQNPDAQNTYLLLERALSPDSPQKRQHTINPITAQGNRYIDFLIPGLIALGIMNTCMWGISWNLIEFRMKKLLRRMVATPMKKTEFMISLIISRLLLGGFEALVLFAFAHFYFDVMLTGSLIALFLIFLAGVVAFSGISVIAASRSASSQVGNGLINAIVLPMTILSGIFFSYHNFPEPIVSVLKYLPLTVLADAIRGIFIEGLGVGDIIAPMITLIVPGIVLFFAGLKIFKWY
jgi:ABC-2 type transport system permease protein